MAWVVHFKAVDRVLSGRFNREDFPWLNFKVDGLLVKVLITLQRGYKTVKGPS
jgi:hypothetical protein